MSSHPLLSLIAIAILGYLIFRISKWRDKMMREDGFSAGGRAPTPDAWIDKQLREAKLFLPRADFDAFLVAGVLSGVIQAEAKNNAYRSRRERQILRNVRQVVEASRRNPTLAQLGMLDPKEVSSIRIEPDKTIDFFVKAYAESKSVFNLKDIQDLSAVFESVIAPRYKQVILDYKNSQHADADKRIARGSFLLLSAIGHFASVNESFNQGMGYQEFAWESTTYRFVNNATHLVNALSDKLPEIESVPDSGVDELMKSLF